MRYVPLALLLIACEPSKADVAATNCRRASSAADWDRAIVFCQEAMRLNRKDESLHDMWFHAVRASSEQRFQEAETRRRFEDRLERQTMAAERQAAAAQALADPNR